MGVPCLGSDLGQIGFVARTDERAEAPREQRFEDAVVCAVLRAADAPSREEVRVGPVREATSGRGQRARVPPRSGGRDAVERAEHEDGDAPYLVS